MLDARVAFVVDDASISLLEFDVVVVGVSVRRLELFIKDAERDRSGLTDELFDDDE
jgi:hypothetical protein